MQIFDTHCHYNLEPLAQDWQKYYQQAQKKAVVGCITVGTTIETSQLAIDQAEQAKNMFCSVGLHPHVIQDDSSFNITAAIHELENLITTDSKQVIKAIGEVGLDYYRIKTAKNETMVTQQKKLCAEQIKLAVKHNLPAIFHIRDNDISEKPVADNAYWDAWQLIENTLKANPDFSYIIHCASGPISFIKKCIETGAYISFAGNLTYTSADHLRTLATLVPHQQLLLETDAPFLAPQKYRGKLCQPEYIQETGRLLTELTDVSEQQLLENSQKVFGIKL